MRKPDDTDKLGVNASKLISPLLFLGGIVFFIASVGFSSSIIAFIGLGLVFWGAILFYSRPERYIKEMLLTKTTLPSLELMNQIITGLGYKAGVYLPPNYFTAFETVKVYLRSDEILDLPSPEEIQRQENYLFLKETAAILLNPPGLELMKLFEHELKTSFTQINLQYLKQNLPKLLIELEIAQNMKMELVGDVISMRIESSVYADLCMEIESFSKVYSSLGCPLTSAIACALAKASGKPLMIAKTEVTKKTKEIMIQYRLLEV